jgi:hypothetical protein
VADDLCGSCGHAVDAHAYADENGAMLDPSVVQAEDFDEGSAVRGPCQHPGCGCSGFTAGGELHSTSADEDAQYLSSNA